VETLSCSVAIYEGYVVQHCRENFTYSMFKMFEWKPQSISRINTGFGFLKHNVYWIISGDHIRLYPSLHAETLGKLFFIC